MNSAILRLLACAFMLADHVGALFFPEQIGLRLIGRLAFPIFAFLISEGCHYSRNRPGYLKRLLVLAAISQMPYSLLFPSDAVWFNVVFTLATGVFAIFAFPRFGWLSPIICAVLAEILRFDYGSAGVLLVFFFWYFGCWKYGSIAVIGVFSFVLALRQGLICHFWGQSFVANASLELFSLISLYILSAYNRVRGWKMRGFFYGFYPVHLLLIYAIKSIF